MISWKLAAPSANCIWRNHISRHCVSEANLKTKFVSDLPGNHRRSGAYHNMIAVAYNPTTETLKQGMTMSALPAKHDITTTPYGVELDAACQAVRLASQLCKTVQLQLTDAEKTDKADESPVTVADYGAQALVAWALQEYFANESISMVAEEDSRDLRTKEGANMRRRVTELVNQVVVNTTKKPPVTEEQVVDLIDIGQSSGGPTGRHWVLDPIDGTRGFVGLRQYAVCLGLIQDGKVVLGVLGCPNLLVEGSLAVSEGGPLSRQELESDDIGVMFYAVRGAGAYSLPLADVSAAAQRVRVNDPLDLSALRFMESYESRHSDHSLTASLGRQIGITSPSLRVDSQVKYGAMARGDASLFMRFPPSSYREKIWDHCAGCVIVEEAGGKITDAGGNPLDFSRGRWLDLDRGIVAASPSIHSKLMDLLNQ